jgi:hypothetical protein
LFTSVNINKHMLLQMRGWHLFTSANKGNEVTKRRKTRTVAFRVDEEVFGLIENEAVLTGDGPHDWCRGVITSRLSGVHELSASERLIYEEVARVRYLVSHGFRLIATDQMNPKNWEAVVSQADQKAAQIAQALLARHTNRDKGL